MMQIGFPIHTNSIIEKSLYIPLIGMPYAAIKVVYNVTKIAILVIVAWGLKLACQSNSKLYQQACLGLKHLARGSIALMPFGGIYLYHIDKKCFQKEKQKKQIFQSQIPSRIKQEKALESPKIDAIENIRKLADAKDFEKALKALEILNESEILHDLDGYIFQKMKDAIRNSIPEKWTPDMPLTSETMHYCESIMDKFHDYIFVRDKRVYLHDYMRKIVSEYFKTIDVDENNFSDLFKLIKNLRPSYLQWILLNILYDKVVKFENVDLALSLVSNAENLEEGIRRNPKEKALEILMMKLIDETHFSEDNFNKAKKIYQDIQTINIHFRNVEFFKKVYLNFRKLNAFDKADHIADLFLTPSEIVELLDQKV